MFVVRWPVFSCDSRLHSLNLRLLLVQRVASNKKAKEKSKAQSLAKPLTLPNRLDRSEFNSRFDLIYPTLARRSMCKIE